MFVTWKLIFKILKIWAALYMYLIFKIMKIWAGYEFGFWKFENLAVLKVVFRKSKISTWLNWKLETWKSKLQKVKYKKKIFLSSAKQKIQVWDQLNFSSKNLKIQTPLDTPSWSLKIWVTLNVQNVTSQGCLNSYPIFEIYTNSSFRKFFYIAY